MGNRVLKGMNIEGTTFLGAEGTKHKGYLKYHFEKEIEGTDDEKFEAFKKLVNENEDLKNWTDKEGIIMASCSEEMLSDGGFIDGLTDEQAEILYTELKNHLK